jgi:hypothetical protein
MTAQELIDKLLAMGFVVLKQGEQMHGGHAYGTPFRTLVHPQHQNLGFLNINSSYFVWNCVFGSRQHGGERRDFDNVLADVAGILLGVDESES